MVVNHTCAKILIISEEIATCSKHKRKSYKSVLTIATITEAVLAALLARATLLVPVTIVKLSNQYKISNLSDPH
jgi:hypothetical protein